MNNHVVEQSNLGNKPIKVAMISMHASPIARLGGYKSGGMNLYIKEIALRLSKLDVKVDIFTKKDETHDGTEIIELGPGVRIIYINAGPKKNLEPAYLEKYVDKFIDELSDFVSFENIQYDLVHSHYWLSGIIGLKIAKLWSLQHITMFHTLSLAKEMALGERSDLAHRKKIEAEIIKDVDAIICSSTHEKNLINSYIDVPDKKIHIIPLAVDDNVFHPNDMNVARQKLNISNDVKIIMSISRLDPVKGLDVLIKSIARIKNKSAIKLFIIGGVIGGADSPSAYQIYLKELVQSLNLNENVEFLGAIAHGDLPKYYTVADIIAIPSHYESFGLVTLEAFASAKPVVASNTGGLASIIDHEINGLLVDPGNVEQLADALNSLLENSHTSKKIGQQAFLDVQKYSWDTTAYSVFKVYKSMLSNVMKVKRASSY
jgi:D-inositol-3-phosphate glycosyltransferase